MDAEQLHELLDALDRLVERVNGGTDTEHEDEEPAESARIEQAARAIARGGDVDGYE